MGLLPPSINASLRQFSVVDDENTTSKKSIIYGLGAIKGVGTGAIDNIIALRSEKAFENLDDFASRVDNFQVNKKVIEALNFAGALDCLGKTRLSIIQNIENILETMKKIATVKKEAANSLFGEDETTEGIVVEFVENEKEYPIKELLKLELDSLGIYISGHPLQDFKAQIDEIAHIDSAKFDEVEDNSEIICIGKLEEIKTMITKKGTKMGRLKILDFGGSFEAVAFDRVYSVIDAFSTDELDAPHAFKARFTRRADGGTYQLTINEIFSLKDAKNGNFKAKTESKYKNSNGGNGGNGENGNFGGGFGGGRKFAEKESERSKNARDYEFEINLNELNKEKINLIYNLVHNEFKNPNNFNRLILRVRDEKSVFVYETEFFVGDDFNAKVGEILSA